MKLGLVVTASVLLLASAPALACRCRQLKLDEYFERAEVVFLARALATWVVEEGEEAPGYRAVRFEAEGSPYKGDPVAFQHLATPLSSATCGYAVEVGRVYLVFAAAHEAGDRIAWFDTCNGTRSFDPDAPQGVEGFVDVEPKHVLAQLTARRTVAGGSGGPVLPLPGDPGAELVGLLELPSVLDPESGSAPPPLYASPSDDAAGVSGITASEVVTREHAYEMPAAVVRERRPGWFRIALGENRSAWLRERDAGTFHPVAELLVNRLSYLTEHWDGWTWPSPGAGHPVEYPAARRAGRKEIPANVVAAQSVGGSLFLRVEILSASPCEGGEVKPVQGGWIPAYTPGGKLTAWFYSRGC